MYPSEMRRSKQIKERKEITRIRRKFNGKENKHTAQK